MKQVSANRAILILESPWELDEADSNRTSVLPFIEGVAKLAGNTEVYHANFYDSKSFEQALDCLCKRKFINTTVYIAAHGYKTKIGKSNLGKLIYLIGERSKEFNITGLMLGSCFVGENTPTMEVYLEGTNIKWCAGYASTSYWLEGTLIDCAIIANMSELDRDTEFTDRDLLIDAFARSISPFSKGFHIGDDYKDNPVRLEDSLTFVVQPSGKGFRAKTVTAEVFERYSDYQV
ncbi:MAG TPA: hypothetical protein VJY83_02785 [Thiopseudomonas sp.]|nr:hypothetical protein [Thiopseudomonas sp.]